jgi:hypothetical protein
MLLLSLLLGVIAAGELPQAPQLRYPYAEAREKALATNTPLVIAVRCNPPEGEWVLSHAMTTWPWGEGSFVIVALPKNGELYGRQLPAPATTADVQNLLKTFWPPAPTTTPVTPRPAATPTLSPRPTYRGAFVPRAGAAGAPAANC